ncbi:MAG: hypothetical protein K6E72_05330 [Saccharofermentans sp.]|nr:hypothetical protein [Saccharofermentans sp.]
MIRIIKTKPGKRIVAIIRGNEGASIVLVTIIAILVITGVVILRVATGALWASADHQLYYDQAYEMATSFGDSLDVLILKEKSIKLSEIAQSGNEFFVQTTDTGLPNSSLKAKVSADQDSFYDVTVEAKVADASYVYTAKYRISGGNYTRQY